MRVLAFAILAGIGLAGCSFNGFSSASKPSKEVVVQKVDRDDIIKVMKEEGFSNSLPEEVTLTATGEGIAPQKALSIAQAKILAKHAALAAAHANLAGKLYGVRINGEDTVQNAMLQNSRVTARVQGLVKNAAIIDEGFSDGIYKVTLQLNVTQEKWREVFSY